MKERKWILIRHAHRDTTNPAADNGLSRKGHDQAQAMVKFYQSRFQADDDDLRDLHSFRIYTSPKKRCQETVAPLARQLGVEVEVCEFLGERQAGEGLLQLSEKIEKFKRMIDQSDLTTVVFCSHGDWIPFAVERWSGISLSQFKKGAWIEFDELDGNFHLAWLVQKY